MNLVNLNDFLSLDTFHWIIVDKKKLKGERIFRFASILQCIRLSEKFLSFYKEIIDTEYFLFYISLLNYART